MIIENVLGTFEVDEVRRTIKAISLEEQVLHSDYSQMALVVNRVIIDYYDPILAEQAFHAFRKRTEFPYRVIAKHYVVNISQLFLQEKATKTLTIGRQSFTIGGDNTCMLGIRLPLDVLTINRLFASRSVTGQHAKDIYDYYHIAIYRNNLPTIQSQPGFDKALAWQMIFGVNDNSMDPENVANALGRIADLKKEIDNKKALKKKLTEKRTSIEQQIADTDSELSGLEQEYDELYGVIAPLIKKVAQAAQAQQAMNKNDRFSQLPNYTQAGIVYLAEKLREHGYIEYDSIDNVLYIFGHGNQGSPFVKWTAKNERTREPSKISLLDLLVLMGYSKNEIRAKINGTFQVYNKEKVSPYRSANYPNAYDWPPNSEYHTTLQHIVEEAKHIK